MFVKFDCLYPILANENMATSGSAWFIREKGKCSYIQNLSDVSRQKSPRMHLFGWCHRSLRHRRIDAALRALPRSVIVASSARSPGTSWSSLSSEDVISNTSMYKPFGMWITWSLLCIFMLRKFRVSREERQICAEVHWNSEFSRTFVKMFVKIGKNRGENVVKRL